MSSGTNVLERSVIQAGKVFIRAGEDLSRAYVIQGGEIAAFIMQDDRKIEVARFGPGTIIGEIGLMIDEDATLSYEAITVCTVVTITRQDFQKKLVRADKSIATILEHAVNKITYYERIETTKALVASEVDETALLLLKSLLRDVAIEKKLQYEDTILPHLNGLIKAIKGLKKKSPKKEDEAEE